jgi:hypothetical protein
MEDHRHKGGSSGPRIDIVDLNGLIPTVSAAPTYIPTKFQEQFRIYQNGATKRLYMYNTLNSIWLSASFL